MTRFGAKWMPAYDRNWRKADHSTWFCVQHCSETFSIGVNKDLIHTSEKLCGSNPN